MNIFLTSKLFFIEKSIFGLKKIESEPELNWNRSEPEPDWTGVDRNRTEPNRGNPGIWILGSGIWIGGGASVDEA